MLLLLSLLIPNILFLTKSDSDRQRKGRLNLEIILSVNPFPLFSSKILRLNRDKIRDSSGLQKKRKEKKSRESRKERKERKKIKKRKKIKNKRIESKKKGKEKK